MDLTYAHAVETVQVSIHIVIVYERKLMIVRTCAVSSSTKNIKECTLLISYCLFGPDINFVNLCVEQSQR